MSVSPQTVHVLPRPFSKQSEAEEKSSSPPVELSGVAGARQFVATRVLSSIRAASDMLQSLMNISTQEPSLNLTRLDVPPLPPQQPAVPAKDRQVLNGRYEINVLRGAGSYGLVVQATDLTLNRTVAIKRIRRVFQRSVDAVYTLRELRILRMMNHPNVVSLLDVLPPEDANSFNHLDLAMEYMEYDLLQLSALEYWITPHVVSQMMFQLLCGLQHIHAGGVLHRDIKPGNLLCNRSGILKIYDFGLSRFVAEPTLRFKHRSLTKHVVTRYYRPPELLLLCADYDAKVDVWSAGCVMAELFQMVQGCVPSIGHRAPLFPGGASRQSRDHNYVPNHMTDRYFLNGSGMWEPVDSQLANIIGVLGTPDYYDIATFQNTDLFYQLRSIPFSPAMNFRHKFPVACNEGLDLLRRMLQFNPLRRISVDEALRHPYFAKFGRRQTHPIPRPAAMDFSFDSITPSPLQLRAMVCDEIRLFQTNFPKFPQ
eukprot:952247_1